MAICNRRVDFRKGKEEGSSRLRSAQEVIASNDDLLTELLLRLPIKSLLKFKSVCKHWLSLVSDPHFIHRRNLESKAVSALYVLCKSLDTEHHYYEFVPLDPLQTMARLEYLNFADSPRSVAILQSCKGLFLCRSFGEVKYLVYNPTIKQFKTLPPLPPVPPAPNGVDMEVWGFNLAFDPSKSHFYKVVCTLGDDSNPGEHWCQILIYSSQTGCWSVSGAPSRVSGVPFSPPLFIQFWNGVLFNGAIHWGTYIHDASLYFDLDEEVIREMPMPPPVNFDSPMAGRRYFGESGGHLHLVDSYELLTTHLDVYEMEQDRSGWFLKFRVDRDVLAGFTMPYEGVHLKSVFHVDRGEQEEDSFMVVHLSNNKVIRYNFITQTHQEIHDMHSRPTDVSPFAHQYIESLALV